MRQNKIIDKIITRILQMIIIIIMINACRISIIATKDISIKIEKKDTINK